jgi:hypothetical protein
VRGDPGPQTALRRAQAVVMHEPSTAPPCHPVRG